MSELVLREADGAATRLTLNDAGTRNSLSLGMISALREALASINTTVAIIAAHGPVFCSGHNLKEITGRRSDADGGADFYNRLFTACSELMMDITQHGSAIIAEVGGLASAAGCQLAASCDIVVAGDKAGFCTPGVNIGLFCSTPMVALSRSVGQKHAMEMLLTGAVIPADEACRMGLVNRVVPQEGLRAATSDLAAVIGRKSPEAIRIGKKAFAEQAGLPLAEAYAAMGRVMAGNLQCGDAREGISAFIEKRTPSWTAN
jgi:enoyl-CoA hydratase/carnithine racemase